MISHKWWKTGHKLVLLTYRKSHMGFRLVLKVVALNGVIDVILHYFTKLGMFGANYVKVLYSYSLLQKWSPKNLIFLAIYNCIITSRPVRDAVWPISTSVIWCHLTRFEGSLDHAGSDVVYWLENMMSTLQFAYSI